ncbi:MAG: type II secretion system protein [Anaerovoracaceae bacterium]
MFRSLKNKNGFTMIELIAVIVILGIIAAITVPSMVGYINKAEQKRLDTTARSIFNAASNALNSQYARGFKGEFNQGDGTVDVSLINPKYEEDQANSANIKYIQIKKNDPDKYDSILYRLLEDKIGDKTILQQNVLVEYNWKTGNVLSAFFADDKDILSIGYGSQSGQVDVYKRDENTRKQSYLGMWDVNSTGPAEEEPEVPEEKPGVQLVDYGAKYYNEDGTEAQYDKGNNINNGNNYGLLTAEFKLPKGFVWSNKEVEIKLNYGEAKEIILASIKKEKDYNAIASNTFDKAIIKDKNKKLNNVYIENNTIVMILDTSMEDGYNSGNQYVDYVDIKDIITDNKFKVTEDNPHIQVKASIKGESDFQSKFAKPFFSGGLGVQNNSSANIDVSSIRHIKYMDQVLTSYTGTINQQKNISFRNYNNDIVKRIGHNEPLKGKYKGNGYTLWDMTITDNYNGNGLFSTVNKNCRVENLAINYSDDYWNRYDKATNKDKYFVSGEVAGFITGRNSGTIENCQVLGKVTATNTAGGIAGVNDESGKITKCYSGGDIVAHSYGGGIVGHNMGVVNYCEVGTFATRNGSRVELVGTPMYGLLSNIGKYPKNNGIEVLAKVKNDANIISNGGLNYNSSLGGIIGWNKNNPYIDVKYCVNGAKVISKYQNSSLGGIVGTFSGYNYGKEIYYSYNGGSIEGGNCAGGIVGRMTNDAARIYECYNTGKISKAKYNGGIIGDFRKGYIEHCYTLTNSIYGTNTNNLVSDSGVIGTKDDEKPGITAYTKESLKKAYFGNLIPKGNGATGFFNYPYGYIHYGEEGSGYEYLFHRTPWEN